MFGAFFAITVHGLLYIQSRRFITIIRYNLIIFYLSTAGDAGQLVLSRAHEKNQKAMTTCLSFLLWPLYLLYLGTAHAPAGDDSQHILSRAHEKNQKAMTTCLSFLLWPLYLLYLGTAHAPAGDSGQGVLNRAHEKKPKGKDAMPVFPSMTL